MLFRRGEAFEGDLECRTRGLDVAVEGTPGHFNGGERRQAFRETGDSLLDAFEKLFFGRRNTFEARAERTHEAVRDENSEQRAGESRSHFFSDRLRSFGDGRHRVDDAQNGGDDSDGWQ